MDMDITWELLMQVLKPHPRPPESGTLPFSKNPQVILRDAKVWERLIFVELNPWNGEKLYTIMLVDTEDCVVMSWLTFKSSILCFIFKTLYNGSPLHHIQVCSYYPQNCSSQDPMKCWQLRSEKSFLGWTKNLQWTRDSFPVAAS